MLGRISLINRLLKDNIINLDKPHHLLGCGLPQEFTYYKGMDFIETVDTSNPVVHAIKGIRYNEWGLLDKESQKLVDLFNTNAHSINRETLYYNLTKFNALGSETRSSCKADKDAITKIDPGLLFSRKQEQR